jgi:hypothetical protein
LDSASESVVGNMPDKSSKPEKQAEPRPLPEAAKRALAEA